MAKMQQLTALLIAFVLSFVSKTSACSGTLAALALLMLSPSPCSLCADDVKKPAATNVFIDIKARGAKGDGKTDDRAVVQKAIDEACGGTLFFPVGTYRLAGSIRVPPFVSLRGAGMNVSLLEFTGADHGIVAASADGYEMSGSFSELWVRGSGTAHVGILIRHRQHGTLDRVRVSGFPEQAIYLDYTLMMSIRDCLVQGGGNLKNAAIEVDNSTTFHWYNSRVSHGNNKCVAGLRIDRTAPFVLLGGALESCGVPLQFGFKTEGNRRTGPGSVIGVDLENPTGHYVDVGLGWTGTPGWGPQAISFREMTCSLSGSSTATDGFRFKNSNGCFVGQCNFNILRNGTIISLEGSNPGFSTGVNGVSDASQKYICRDGQVVSGARATVPWSEAAAPSSGP
jgi:hypothetical protein